MDKTFSVLLDEDDSVEVIPSKWISPDKKTYKWPKTNVKSSIKKMIDADESWEDYQIKRIIKTLGNNSFSGKHF